MALKCAKRAHRDRVVSIVDRYAKHKAYADRMALNSASQETTQEWGAYRKCSPTTAPCGGERQSVCQ